MINQTEQTDVVVIGGGPSGALVSALLRQRGWHVVVLEGQHFPRFSIGESLLPQCMAYLSEAGMDEVVDKHAEELGFQFKNGAAFHYQGTDTAIDFTDKFSAGRGTTYQVKRAAFDKLLADTAQAQGVEIRYGHRVEALQEHDEHIELSVASEQQSYRLQARFVLDASGFGRVLPRLLDLERRSSLPTRTAYFCHINDHISAANFDRNKILISVHPQHRDIWYWLIPFADGSASLGVVGEPEYFDEALSEQQNLWRLVGQEPNLAALLDSAQAITDTQRLGGYSADVSRLYGKRYALLGNAGEFLDPVFSSGVTIALKSASLAAPVVDGFLRGEKVDFDKDFAQPLKQGVECFKTFVLAWYDGRFQDVIFYPQQRSDVRRMISAILAGYAWDESNPYVAQSERRLDVLATLCNMEAQ
ncbi:NAD(P)/FAD-dependent oxidoreductase [Pseudoalteromonas ruthenica]|uniref:NAD(P)/FAD-dependent oxidoreductase n=1 Tax=Pseudoalteromonas ruthenica TaxID=151081 RepID=UPI0003B66040|nr:NAD(P)/FAD-dependent oxidoreductase [Pseudoalteromonas ruthenica]